MKVPSSLILVLFASRLLFAEADESLLSPEAFTQLYHEVWTSISKDNTIEIVNPLELVVKQGEEGSTMKILLGNAYQMYQSDPDSLKDVLMMYLARNIQTLQELESKNGYCREEPGSRIENIGMAENVT